MPYGSLRFWPSPVPVTAPDGQEYEVRCRAVGFPRGRVPPAGQERGWVWLCLPVHTVAVLLGRGWAVEVVDVAARRRWPRLALLPYVPTEVARVATDDEAIRLAAGVVRDLAVGRTAPRPRPAPRR